MLTRFELLTMLYSLQALLKAGLVEEAQEVLDKVVKQAESMKKDTD